jgi:hypothetical protein
MLILNFNKIKAHYTNKFWTKEMVKNAVGKKITETEYKEITSEDYTK